MSISVLMSVYFKENSEYLKVCLQSLAVQTLKADEVVLVLDGPISPQLQMIIERFRESLNIVSVPLSENVGLASALNEGLKHCLHDLVARMDTDDIALPDRFEKQIAYMQSNPDVVVCSGIVEEFDVVGVTKSFRYLPLTHNELLKFAKSRSPLSHPAVMFRKSAVLSVGGYQDLYPEDYLLWIILIQNNYKIGNLPDILVKMRADSDFMKRRGWRFLKGELKVYNYMYDTNFINLFEFFRISLIKSFLRLSPNFVKILLYKFIR